MGIVIFYIHIVGSYYLNFNNVRKIYWMMIVNSLRAVNEYSVWPDGTLQCTMKSENKQCMFKQDYRFVIRGHFRQYILIAGLQLSIPRGVDLSKYHLSSVDVRLVSIINHLFISSTLFFTAMSTLATGRRLLPVGTAPVWCCGGAS